ncbi:hypothetical protein FS749_014268 [Ceratobasidium sp. UAMH 11750]|nr:hypothetical protein FS749_014268 [Ceratobasidium sp. UAMH 11750]
MAPKTNKSAPGTKVYDFAKHPTRIGEITAAIARTPKMIIMCGPGVSGAVPLAYNGYTSATTLRAAIDDCSTLNPHAKQLSQNKLAAFSVAMTRLRMQARTAPLTSFLQFLQRAFSENRVACCLTENFDGLEERGASQADCRVVMINGDNRRLRCCMPTCKGVDPRQAAELDMQLLSAELVPCPDCTAEAAKMKSQRAAGPPALRFLRPAVQSNMDGNLQPGGKTRDAVLDAAEGCDLLLVVGVSLKSQTTFKLVRDVATAVHTRYGVVVYIDHQAVKGVKIDHCIDFHLRVDAQLCSQRIIRAMDEVANDDVDMRFLDDNDSSDMWYDILNNDLARETTFERPPWTKPSCCICNIGLSECLLKCQICGDYLCYSGGYNLGMEYRCCVVLHTFSTNNGRLLGCQSIEQFICPYCWDHRERGMYPHYVRPAPRVYNEEPGGNAPRMAMLVYFLEQFWPQTKHLCALVAGRWKSFGWPCYVQPIKLEEACDKGNILGDWCALSNLHAIGIYGIDQPARSPWEAGSFDLFVVYVTHGLSESRGYQLSHKTSLAAPEFFDRTLAPAQSVVMRAKHKYAFLVCCGTPFDYPDATRELQQWINNGGTFNALIGCLNKKLAPAFIINLVARVTTSLVGADESPGQEVLNCWLSEALACGHTDLIYMTKGLPPCMWIFSPFNSRPLGKELPNLLGVCSCQQERVPGGGNQLSLRKFWIVSHEGSAHHGKPLREVRVKATCSRCAQTWIMPVDDLDGHLHIHGGLYAVVVPYFASH